MSFEKVPAALKSYDQWVLWKYIDRDGERSKCLFQVNGRPAKTNDPDTWTAFVEAEQMSKRGGWEGIGFVFSDEDPFCGIDLDACLDPATNKVHPWAMKWIRKFDSYTEVSPSGTGVKIFCRASNPRGSGKKKDLNGDPIGGKTPGVEIYDKLRFFCVTGKGKRLIEPRQKLVDEFCNEYFPERQSTSTAPSNTSVTVLDRARRYVATMPPAISGSSGHNRTFNVACVLRIEFDLSEGDALTILSEYNNRCDPPWSEKDLQHKIQDAGKQPGERGRLANTPVVQFHEVRIPDYAKEAAKQPKAKTDGMTTKAAALLHLEQRRTGAADLVELGIPDLDYAVGGGVARGEIVILAARPSHGKTAIALQMLDAASRNGIKGLMISEEMSYSALGKRVIQFVSETPEEHWDHDSRCVTDEMDSYFQNKATVWIEESVRTAANAKATIAAYVSEREVGMVVIDYAQLLNAKGHNSYERTSQVSRTMREIVQSHPSIVLVVVCQLNRSIESRDKFVPKMSDLRDTGQLEQDADVIIFGVWSHKVKSSEPTDKYQFYVAKNKARITNTAAFDCRFLPSRQQFWPPRPEDQDSRREESRDWNRGNEGFE